MTVSATPDKNLSPRSLFPPVLRHFAPRTEAAGVAVATIETGKQVNISPCGHPSGKAWRQHECMAYHGYWQETRGTSLHGKCRSSQMLVWASGTLAEGLYIRAVAHVFEVDPITVPQWCGIDPH